VPIPVRIFLLLALSGCATRLEPVSLPAEYAPPPSLADHWLELEAVREDNWFHLLNSGPEALDWRLRAIDSATQSIQLQSFLWQFDISGSMLTSHIVAAADRGVRVRILIDDSFTVGQDQQVIELDTHPKIEYRIFNPFKRRTNSVSTRQILNLGEFHRLDHRMHNKSMVIDNRVAIVGGRNLADDYFGIGEAGNFRDMEVIAAGPIVQDISSSFDQYWNDQWTFPARQILKDRKSASSAPSTETISSTGREIHLEESESNRAATWIALANAAPSGNTELIVDDPPVNMPGSGEEAPVQLASDILELIDSAQKELRIVSAYLIPTAEFEAAVERAEDRGVEVHLLTNSIQSNNHITAHSAYRHHVERLIDHGADLHEVRVDAAERGRYILAPVGNKELALHAKLMVVDGSRVFIGSANFDARSLRINTEMGLLIESDELGQQVLDAIAVDFLPQNAWHNSRNEEGKLQWVSDDEVLDSQPAASFMQRIEDWFFAHLPLEDEM
jgi:putative cardiolipin synthase